MGRRALHLGKQGGSTKRTRPALGVLIGYPPTHVSHVASILNLNQIQVRTMTYNDLDVRSSVRPRTGHAGVAVFADASNVVACKST
jgi:hypothetical protein